MNKPWFQHEPHGFFQKSAVIIGAGLAGCHMAFALAKRGWRVTLMDKSATLASGASAMSAGLATPLMSHVSDPVGQFYHHGFAHLVRLVRSFPKASGCHRTGVLWLKEHSDYPSISQNIASDYANVPLKCGGILVKDGLLIQPRLLCHFLIQQIQSQCQWMPSCEVSQIVQEKHGWTIISQDNAVAHADIVVLCQASAVQKWYPWLPLQIVRGQITRFKAKNFPLAMPLSYGGYVTPSIDGEHICGATFHRDDDCVEAREVDHQHNVEKLAQLVDIDNIDLQIQGGEVGFRTATYDRRPIIGPVIDDVFYRHAYADLHHGKLARDYPLGKTQKGLYLSVAHGSRGFVSAAYAAELLACMIEGKAYDPAMAMLVHPARHMIRRLKRNI